MKKGQGLGINTIVIAALALVILIILILVFRTQIQKGTQRYLNISEEAEIEARDKDRCETLFSGRECLTDCKAPRFFEVPGDWPDCKGDKSHCCERV